MLQDETTALSELRTEWVRLGRTDPETCMGEAKIGGFASYVEPLTCPEMTHDVVSANASPHQPRAISGSPSTRPNQTDVTTAH